MKAKRFLNGRSQAVRLPKAFRFEGKEVAIRKEGEAVILEPIEKRSWPENFFAKIRTTDPQFKRPKQPRTPDVKSIEGQD